MVAPLLPASLRTQLSLSLSSLWQDPIPEQSIRVLCTGPQHFQVWVLRADQCLYFQGQYNATFLYLEQKGQRYRFPRHTRTQEKPSSPRLTPESESLRYAPLNASISSLSIQVGQEIQAGDVLYVLSAMKMQMVYHAPCEGTITHVYVTPGDTVSQGQQIFDWKQETVHDP